MIAHDLFAQIERTRKRVTVYAPSERRDVVEGLRGRNVDVAYRSLPDGVGGFVVVRDDEEFVASIGLDEFGELFEPPIERPWTRELVDEGYRALFEILDEALFVALDRRQLLAASREIENRAWRVGRGTIRVGFQRLTAFRDQLPVYARLADETDLAIHVYGRDDWEPPSIPGITVHEVGGDVTRYWFLAFDGGPDRLQATGLLAEECEPGRFRGFWTYDAALVDRIAAIGRGADG